MRHIRIPFLVVVLSLALTGMAFALDLPRITTWSAGTIPGLTVLGVGGGGSGFGDTLVGPLYDVRQLTDPNLPGTAGTTARAQYTLIAIVNTDPTWGTVARLRFREWKRSRECLDLDIPLTSNDVWVAEVSRVSGGGAVLNSPDRYVSQIPASLNTAFTTSLFPTGGFPFLPYAIESQETNPAARCEYGYFELIGEEKVYAPNTTFQFPRVGTVAGGVYTPVLATDPPTGYGGGRDVGSVLMGNTYIIRPDVAISHQYNLTAIANFAVDPAGIWASTATAFPTLKSAVQGEGTNPGAGGFDNLEALLSKRWVDFQYVDQGALGGYDPADTTLTPMSTSAVITFPTKHHHYATTAPFSILAGALGTPFTGARETSGDQSLTPAQATPDFGEIVTAATYDRSEHLLTVPTTAISPSPTPGITRLPYEVNIIGLRPVDSPVIDFRNNVVLPTSNTVTSQLFFSGWAEIDLSPYVPISSADTRTNPQGKVVPGTFNFFNNFFSVYRGLPALGIVMTEFYNGAVSGYYGNTVPWQYGVDWRQGAVLPND